MLHRISARAPAGTMNSSPKTGLSYDGLYGGRYGGYPVPPGWGSEVLGISFPDSASSPEFKLIINDLNANECDEKNRQIYWTFKTWESCIQSI